MLKTIALYAILAIAAFAGDHDHFPQPPHDGSGGANTPEPATFLPIAAALIGLGVWRKRKTR